MTDQERKAMEMALEALEAKGAEWVVLERKARIALRQALAQPEQEPFMWTRKNYSEGSWTRHEPPNDPENWTPLYTAPPSKPWVSLTDEEIMEPLPFETRKELVRWIEAKLREKNK